MEEKVLHHHAAIIEMDLEAYRTSIPRGKAAKRAKIIRRLVLYYQKSIATG